MSFKEHNNREISKKLAEYITGTELRKYVARKVKQFINLKIKFEQDIEEIENRINLIYGYSKVYMEHVFKFY